MAISCIVLAIVGVAALASQASTYAQVAVLGRSQESVSTTTRNAAQSEIKPSLFEAALALYDKDDYDTARRRLQEISEAERTAEVQAMLYRLRLPELLQEAGERNKATGGNLNPLDSFIQLNEEVEQIIEQLETVQIAHRDSSLVLEMTGELTNDFASLLMLQVEMLKSMKLDDTAREYEGRSIVYRNNAFVMFEKCIKLDDSRQPPHLRLAGLIVMQRGHLNDARIVNHVFRAIEIAPESAGPVSLLVPMMYTTPLLENPRNMERTRVALRSLQGKARQELRTQTGEVRSVLQEAHLASEQIAITGFGSRELVNQINRLSATLKELDVAIAESR